jgi:hypothetical protein
MKFGVFCDVALCSHVELDQRFRGAHCLLHQGLIMINNIFFLNMCISRHMCTFFSHY